MALAYARLANRWARQSAFWAQRAAEATESASLAALATVDVDIEVQYDTREGPRPQPYLVLTNRAATVWIHGIRGAGCVFFDDGGQAVANHILSKPSIQILDPAAVGSILRHKGEWLSATWPWPRVNLDCASRSWARIRIEYSLAEKSPTVEISRDVRFESEILNPE